MFNPIKNAAGETLDYIFSEGAPEARRAGLLVIAGHGVTGNKDRPVIADTCDALNAAGIDTLRFSFAGNGDSEGDFRQSTITKEIGDLGAVLDAVSASCSHICYIGHSMGGAVGVLRAATDTRIHCLISLAGMVDTKAFAEAEFGSEVPDQGVMWEEPDCPLSSGFMNDLRETIGNVTPQAESLRIPWLLIHGSADDVVLPKDSDGIKKLKADAVDLIVIEGAGHSFNEPAHKAALTAAVVDWLSGH